MNLAQALQRAQLLGLDRMDAQVILLHTLKLSEHDRAWLLAHNLDPLDAATNDVFNCALKRRLAGEPMAYITGHQEFYGLRLQVDARVLVPRPDTETLVDWTLQLLQTCAKASIIDLGTGSGAIALALKHQRPHWQVRAVDFSTDALAVAQANADALQIDVQLSQGAWLQGVTQCFDAIVSNPPYIAEYDPHLPALRHEPQQALTSGTEGLDDLRSIIQQAPAHLLEGGWLLLEHGFDQAVAVRNLLHAAGFMHVQSRCDLAGIARCSAGRWQSSSVSAA